MPDGYEVGNGLDPFTNDAAGDPDGDTLSNVQEFGLGTKPNRRDTDSDGLSDGQEVALGTLPLDPDTDDAFKALSARYGIEPPVLCGISVIVRSPTVLAPNARRLSA